MDILVMGGTVFLSRAIAEAGLDSGHRVTTFNRGISGDPVGGAQQVTGDRDNRADLAQLAGRSFDLVVDTSYFPYQVRALSALLAVSAKHLVFVSTLNVYPGWPQRLDYHTDGIYDGDPDASGTQAPPWFGRGSGPYGWRKVGAERAALRAFGADRTSILRPGLLVGPGDVMGQLPWWIGRISQGGEVLCPGRPDDALTVFDVRDLALFALQGCAGTFEVTGARQATTRDHVFRCIRAATGSDAQFTWVDDDWLVGHGVTPFSEIPLWLPTRTAPSLFGLHSAAARRAAEEAASAGLSARPLAQTIGDIWSWMQALDGGWRPAPDVPGLTPERERQLLIAWRDAAG